MTFLIWLLKHKIALLTLLVGVYIGFFAGEISGKIEGCTNTNLRDLQTNVTIEEEQNEIRNHRPDNDALLKRLRGGTF